MWMDGWLTPCINNTKQFNTLDNKRMNVLDCHLLTTQLTFFSHWEWLQYMNSKTRIRIVFISHSGQKTLEVSLCRIFSWRISSQQSYTPEHRCRFRLSSALWHHVEWQLCIRVTGKYIPSIILIQVPCLFYFVVVADFCLLGQRDNSINIQTVYTTTTQTDFMRIVAT